MLERCRGVWPERFRHGYAHFAGPMIEEFFFTCVHAFGTINTVFSSPHHAFDTPILLYLHTPPLFSKLLSGKSGAQRLRRNC